MEKKTFALIGAGPLTGLSTAKLFGRLGFRVAMVARRRNSLDQLARELEAQGTEARGFVGDVSDERSLKGALNEIRANFGTVDVLFFAPYDKLDFVPPSAVTVEHARNMFDLLIAGAITCVREVLPDMLERGAGALLCATGRSAIQPMKAIGSASLVTPGLRAYFYELHDELKARGIYAGVVTISVLIDQHHAGKIGAIVLDMYQKRDRIEDVYGEEVEVIRQISGLSHKAVNDFKWPQSVPIK